MSRKMQLGSAVAACLLMVGVATTLQVMTNSAAGAAAQAQSTDSVAQRTEEIHNRAAARFGNVQPDKVSAQPMGLIRPEEAVKAARSVAGGGLLRRVGLKRDSNNTPYYALDFEQNIVHVHAVTGQVTSVIAPARSSPRD